MEIVGGPSFKTDSVGAPLIHQFICQIICFAKVTTVKTPAYLYLEHYYYWTIIIGGSNWNKGAHSYEYFSILSQASTQLCPGFLVVGTVTQQEGKATR